MVKFKEVLEPDHYIRIKMRPFERKKLVSKFSTEFRLGFLSEMFCSGDSVCFRLPKRIKKKNAKKMNEMKDALLDSYVSFKEFLHGKIGRYRDDRTLLYKDLNEIEKKKTDLIDLRAQEIALNSENDLQSSYAWDIYQQKILELDMEGAFLKQYDAIEEFMTRNPALKIQYVDGEPITHHSDDEGLWKPSKMEMVQELNEEGY